MCLYREVEGEEERREKETGGHTGGGGRDGRGGDRKVYRQKGRKRREGKR